LQALTVIRKEAVMPLTQLAKSRWQGYFDEVAKALGAQQVEIQVTGAGFGDQIEANWIPLIGLSYDPKNDVFSIAAEGVEHLINHPAQIHVDQELEALHSVEAIDKEGNHHIVMLRKALTLPAH
jgi:cellulase/cellobiase CelA1